MINIAVLVSGSGTNLQALIDAQNAGKIPGGKITCVISSKSGVYALERAKMHNIETVVVSRSSFLIPEEFDKALVAELERRDLILRMRFRDGYGYSVKNQIYLERVRS